jgi:hypothetical protein
MGLGPTKLPRLLQALLMVIAGIPREEIRHTRAVQDWLAEGRQEGRKEGEAAVTLRLLTRRCGPLSEATAAQIQAPPSSWKAWPPGWRRHPLYNPLGSFWQFNRHDGLHLRARSRPSGVGGS